MRTTITLDDDLLRRLKELAARTGRSMSSLIEDAVRDRLSRTAPARSEAPYRIKPATGRLRPGVDLDDSAALLELMEADDGPV